MMRRTLVWLASFVLVFGLVPLPAFAWDATAESLSTMGEERAIIGEGVVTAQAASSEPIEKSRSALGLFEYILAKSKPGSAEYIDAQCAIDILTGKVSAGMDYPPYQGPEQNESATTATNGESNAEAYKRVNYTSGDAVSLANFETSLTWIDTYNQYRAQENETEGTSLSTTVGMNCRMMAISIVMCDWSKSVTAHSRAFSVGENLAWGYSNPFKGWYTDEKEVYQGLIGQGKSYPAGFTSSEQSAVGHYLNIVDYAGTGYRDDYPTSVTGFATCTDGALHNVCHEQSFYTLGTWFPVDKAYSTTEFRATWLEPYKIALDSADPDPEPDPDPDPDPELVVSVDMLRLYNPNSGEHLYTANGEERDYLVGLGWTDEGVGWVAPNTSGTPVFRLYNPNAGDHHYTMDSEECEGLQQLGWTYEGIGWYSNEGADRTPLLRLYNSNAVGAGSHHYTTDASERDWLVSQGWTDEGVGWYGL